MGGDSFTLACTLRKAGIAIQARALGDTGACGFVFIDSRFASDLCRTLGLKPQQLPHSIYPKGYDGSRGSPITQYLLFNIEIDGRRIYNLPMLIVGLGSHDVIIGKNFFDYFRILIDVHHQRLQWPMEFPPARNYARTVATYTRNDIRPQQIQAQCQQDMFRRDRAIALDEKRRRDGIHVKVLTLKLAESINTTPDADASRGPAFDPSERLNRDDASLRTPRQVPAQDSTYGPAYGPQDARTSRKTHPRNAPTWEKQNQRDLARMARELSRQHDYQPAKQRKKRVSNTTANVKAPLAIDIKMVSGNGFLLDIRQRSVDVFSITLDGLDRMIEDKKEALEQPEQPDESEESLKQKIPRFLHACLDFFSKRQSDALPPHRSIDHKIELTEDNTLGFCHLNKHSLEELVSMREYLSSNLAKGFIVSSKAPFASPVLFARKGDGSLRFCVDYRKLNALTKKNRYPLPLIDETLARLSRAKIFTKLDIRQAFHRIRMSPESEELTAFRTRYGLFQYKVLPFGLTNGPATFQGYINDVLRDLLDVICTAYLDDILIYSEDELQHEAHVKQVVERLRAAGLQADIKKCEFGVKRTKYLGFIISTDGVQVDPDKIKAIAEWDYPGTVRGVQSFLGFCNFYRRFIRDFSRIAAPLTRLTRADHEFDFNEECIVGFEALRKMLMNAPILAHYDVDSQCLLETDASDTVVAAVFSQKGLDGEWHPVAYFSKTMAPAETNYPIHDKEMLAIVKAMQHWRAELEGTKDHIEVVTDHKALEYFMSSKLLSARQARWAEILSRYNFKISYKPGTSNKADPLTRIESQTKPLDQAKRDNREQVLLPPENLDDQIKRELEVNRISFSLSPIEEHLDLIDHILQANRTALDLARVRKLGQERKGGYCIENGLLKRNGKIVVAESVRTALIAASHCGITTAHPGKGKTKQLIKERYYWLGMDDDVERFVSNCHDCRRSKVPRDKTPGLLHPLPIPDRPWQHISMDFKEMPPDREGMNMVCVFVDRLGKRPVSVPCNRKVDARVMAQLYLVHVHKHYGPATTIVSDRGPQFISAFWEEFCRLLGTRLKLSTAYHPQTDGQTENANQWIDQRLRPFVNTFQDNWSSLIHAVDYAAAVLPHDSTGLSPFMVELGYQPRMDIDWDRPQDTIPVSEHIRKARRDAQAHIKRIHKVWEWCRTSMAKAQERQAIQANKHRRPVDFAEKDKVWVSTRNWTSERPSRKLGYQNEGPYEITEQVGHSYRLKLPDSHQHDVFAPDLLRKDPGNPLPGQHQEPPLPIVYNQQPEWEVERILQSRKRYRKLQYQAKWVGVDHHPEFYDAECFKGAPHKLQAFHDEYPKALGPPVNLQHWIDCYLQGREPENRADDNGWADE
jgi:transposase InsO family protein